jgi:hypothetical protein
MKEAISSLVTPQRKAIGVSQKFGNTGLKKQQGTTRILYDSLPLDGRNQFNFFEGSNNRDFPLTNVGASGNKLTVGELVVIERVYLSFMAYDGDTVPDIVPLGPVGGGIAIDSLPYGDLSLEIANNTVLKPISAVSFQSYFNKNADFDGDTNFEFDTQLVLQPLLEYIWRYRVANYGAVEDAYLRLTFEGTAAIIAPRNTF